MKIELVRELRSIKEEIKETNSNLIREIREMSNSLKSTAPIKLPEPDFFT